MPFIPLELDAVNLIPLAARAAGVDEDAIHGGLNRTYALVFRSQLDRVTRAQLAGLFMGETGKIIAGLVAFGFLEPAEEGIWRVKGSERLINAATQRARAGKARAEGAKRDSKGRLRAKGARSAGAEVQRQSSGPPAEVQRATSENPALTPNTIHQTPFTETEKISGAEAPPPPPDQVDTLAEEIRGALVRGDLAKIESPVLKLTSPPAKKPPKRSEGQQFFDHAQAERERVSGFVPEAEPDPPALNTWFKRALGVCGSVERLWGAYSAWMLHPRDDFWEKRRWPFAGFMDDAVWRSYVPPKESTG